MQSLLLFLLLIVIFFGGMTILRTGLFNFSGYRMKKWLTYFTDTPIKGFFFGTIITAFLQSSSAVMVITIGLIAAGNLTFRQSIGVILGTNVGTTATIEFLAISTESFILPFVLLGAIFSVMRSIKIKSIGFSLFGLGMIFLAMEGFKHLAIPLSNLPLVQESISEMNDHTLYAILLGTIVTAIIQSSSAATGIVMSFLQADIISLGSAISFMLGANVGTCVTAIFAAIGGGKEAKLTSYAHVWLNIIGVIIFIPFLTLFTEFTMHLTSNVNQQLAHASVLFNLIVSLLFLPFVKPFSKFIITIHKKAR